MPNKKEKLTQKQKADLLNIIDGRILLVKLQLKETERLLLADLESVKKYIKFS